MFKGQILDFIYLDFERLRSFVAQASGGVTNERSNKDENKTAGKGELEGGLPLGALKAKGGVDYHYIRTQTETKSVHDALFQEFQTLVLEDGRLIDVTSMTAGDWQEEAFSDGAFLVTGGALKVIDYQSAARTINSLPKLEKTFARLSQLGEGKLTHGKKPKMPPSQLGSLPMGDMASVLEQFYGDAIRLKVFPFPETPNRVLVGTADRSMFRYSPDLLANTYGQVIDANWTCLLQVNWGGTYAPNELTSSTGNQVEDSL